MADDIALVRERLALISAMMEVEGWSAFEAEVNERVAAERRRMDAGQYADLGEYKLHAGILQGLLYALGTKTRLEEKELALRPPEKRRRGQSEE